MDNVLQLERLGNDLATAAHNLASVARGAPLQALPKQNPFLAASPSKEIQRAQGAVLEIAAKVTALVSGPEDFLQQLTNQVGARTDTSIETDLLTRFRLRR